MKALRSSSAMAYNLLGNDRIELIGDENLTKGNYSLSYEWKSPTLRTSKAKANLDAMLISEDEKEAIAIEVKMCEWIFHSSPDISAKYTITGKYYDEESGKVFSEIVESLRAGTKTKMETWGENILYTPLYKKYDAFQMFKHTIALYNAVKAGDLKCNKLTLVNSVWEPDFISKIEEMKTQEHKEFEEFYSKMKPAIELFKSIGVDFDIKYYSFHNFLKVINLPEERKNYLKRY